MRLCEENKTEWEYYNLQLIGEGETNKVGPRKGVEQTKHARFKGNSYPAMH